MLPELIEILIKLKNLFLKIPIRNIQIKHENYSLKTEKQTNISIGNSSQTKIEILQINIKHNTFLI